MITLLKFLFNPLVINIYLLFLWSAVFLRNKEDSQGKKIFVVLATSQWILLSGLRNVTVGADTLAYQYSYYQTNWLSWQSLWENFVDIIFRSGVGKDPGYDMFVKFTQIFFNNYQIYLFLIALIFTIPLGIWIFENSKDPFISFLIYSVLFYAFFSITGHRQTIATALVSLVGYHFIKNRRLLPFVFLTLFAFTIHKSAIIFFPFYFIYKIKITKLRMIIAILAFPLIMIFRIPVSSYFKEISGYNYGIYENARTLNFTMFLMLIVFVSVWKSKIVLHKCQQVSPYYSALLISLLLTPLTWVNPSAMRVVQYFSLFIMLLIPQLIDSFETKEKPFAKLIVIGLLLILYVRNNPQYQFYWS